MILTVACAGTFALGVYAVLVRREIIGILAGAELMLGAAAVQLLVAGSEGFAAGASSFALILLVVAAAEAVVGLALIVTAYRRAKRSRIEEFGEVSG